MDRSKSYYQTPHVKSFMRTIEQCGKSGRGTWLAVLNQTGFCPKGGGQPFDTGTLNGVTVFFVYERGDVITHELAAPLESGTLVEGIIDWQKWYDSMQQHIGEHILSGPVHRRSGYDNVGLHVESEEVTVDFNDPITPEQLDQLENEADQAVYDNVPVEVLYPDKEELDPSDYRSKKELTGLVRIMEIPDADMCACCGIRVENTGEVGIIKIRNMIHYRGGVRTLLLCGHRALPDYRDRSKDETRLSNLPSTRLDLVPEAVEKFKSDLRDREMLMGRLYGQIFFLRTEQHPKRETPLALFEEGLNTVQVRQLSTLLYERKRRSIVMVRSSGNGNEEYQYALRSGYCDMRALSKAMNRQLNGRDGGSALMSQGTFRADRQSATKVFLEGSALLMETGAQWKQRMIIWN